MPQGAARYPCNSDTAYMDSAADPTISYTIPAGGGAITAWQTFNRLSEQGSGATLRLLVLRPVPGTASATVVGSDTETLDGTAGTVSSFPVSPPLPVQAGDVLGLWAPAAFNASPYNCFYASGSVPADELVYEAPGTGEPLAAGATLSFSEVTPQQYMLDLSATLDNDEDAAVTASAGPANATAGLPAELTATVTDNGPASAPIAFTDTVPAGLTLDSAVAADGSCSIAGQGVTCAISGLPAGQSAPVTIVVTPTAAGRYAHTAIVTVNGFTDPVPSNNASGATLTVASAPGGGVTSTTPKCIVPPLTGTPPAIAKRVLALLHCRAGKTTKASSKKVAKGLIVGTRPAAGSTAAAGTTVTLTVSSGPPPRRRRR